MKKNGPKPKLTQKILREKSCGRKIEQNPFSAFSFVRLPNFAHSPTQFLSSPISHVDTIFLIETFHCLLDQPWNTRCGFLLCKHHSPTSPLGLTAPEGSSRRCRVRQACRPEETWKKKKKKTYTICSNCSHLFTSCTF